MRHSGERGMRNLNGRSASAKTPSTFANGSSRLVDRRPGVRIIRRRAVVGLDVSLQVAGHAPVARLAGPEQMQPPADPAAQDLAERPRLRVLAHERVEVILGRLVVDRTDAQVTT